MSNQVQRVPENKIELITRELAAARKRLENVLPADLTVDRQLSFVMLELKKRPDLLQCTVESIIESVYGSSQLGLPVGGPRPEAYLVPYKGKCTLIPSYRGLVRLMRNSGLFSFIDAKPVYQEELKTLEVEYGLNPRLVHRPVLLGEPGPFVGAYFVARMKSGEVHALYLTKEQMDPIRNRSMAKNSGPWQTDAVAMYVKTVVRQAAKLLPWDYESKVTAALDMEDQAEIEAPRVTVDVPAGASKADRVLATLNAKAAARADEPRREDLVEEMVPEVRELYEQDEAGYSADPEH